MYGETSNYEEAKKLLQNIEFSSNIEDCLQDSDALVILTEWNEFRSLSADKLKNFSSKRIISCSIGAFIWSVIFKK